MKLVRNLSLGLALGTLTAAGALLGSVQPASAQAPPGFFAVPGTTTALLITGQVGTRAIYDTADAAVDYPALMPIGSDILIPLFIPATDNVAKTGGNNNGNFHFSAKDFSFGFITSTPTAMGDLGTVLILGAGSNLNDPSGFSQAFQNVGVVVGFGTLGPFMAGINGTLLSDDDAAPDTMGEPLALAGQLGGIQPSFRYTWKGPGGFSLAGSLEQDFTSGVAAGFVGNFPNELFSPGTKSALGGGIATDWGPDAPFNTGTLAARTTWPDLILKARLDQPWGHIALAGLVHKLTSACDNSAVQCVPTGDLRMGGADNMPTFTKTGYGLNLTGHLNTWGKDTLKAGAFWGKGLDHYMGDYGGNQGLQVGLGPTCGGGNPLVAGATTAWCGAYVPTSYGVYAAYQHFWTESLRSTFGAGYSHVNNNFNFQTSTIMLFPAFVGANVDNESHFSAVANLVWSPVPKVDLGLEYVYYHVTYLTNNLGVVGGNGNGGSDSRIEAESIFHF